MARSALKIDGTTLLLLFVQWVVFVGNFAAYWQDPLPWWAHSLIGVVPVHLAFTIWHEAAHGTISNRKWLNNGAGIAGMFPYTTPYFMQRLVHLEHHKFLNIAKKDPNQIYADGPFWQMPFRYVRTIGYARRMLQDDPRSPAMRASDISVGGITIGILGVGLLSGHFLDLVVLWLLPVVIGKVIMDWYVNYLPHVGLPAHRFLGTRILDVRWLTPLVLSHNYHAVHHLWPTIPWHRYIETFHTRLDYLVENGVPIEKQFFGGRLYPAAPTVPTAPTVPDEVAPPAPLDDARQQNA